MQGEHQNLRQTWLVSFTHPRTPSHTSALAPRSTTGHKKVKQPPRSREGAHMSSSSEDDEPAERAPVVSRATPLFRRFPRGASRYRRPAPSYRHVPSDRVRGPRRPEAPPARAQRIFFFFFRRTIRLPTRHCRGQWALLVPRRGPGARVSGARVRGALTATPRGAFAQSPHRNRLLDASGCAVSQARSIAAAAAVRSPTTGPRPAKRTSSTQWPRRRPSAPRPCHCSTPMVSCALRSGGLGLAGRLFFRAFLSRNLRATSLSLTVSVYVPRPVSRPLC